ncbi:MAG: hypothetical protein WC878_05600 [Candidatus Paceibacterota bacterium]
MEKLALRPELSEKDREEQDRLISDFEKNMCPTCHKDVDRMGNEPWTGFCSEECFQEYEKIDPNLRILTIAAGEFNYRHMLAGDAEKLGMPVNEYRKLREEEKLSFADIRDGIRKHDQYKKAA